MDALPQLMHDASCTPQLARNTDSTTKQICVVLQSAMSLRSFPHTVELLSTVDARPFFVFLFSTPVRGA
jgi:hypothetical protein